MSEVQKQWRKEIDLKDGGGVQVFEADTQEELVEKLATAQENATRTIRQLGRFKRFITPDAEDPIPEFKPRILSADEQFRLGQDLQDPAKASSAITALVEAQVGAPIEKLRDSLQQAEIDRRQRNATAAAEQFARDNPEYVVCPENSQAMMGYLINKKLACNKKNLELAFDELKTGALLTLPEQPAIPAKEETRNEEERIVRPRSTGLRPSQASGNPQVRATKGPTREEVERMPRSEYREKFRDPAFRAHVDSLYQQR